MAPKSASRSMMEQKLKSKFGYTTNHANHPSVNWHMVDIKPPKKPVLTDGYAILILKVKYATKSAPKSATRSMRLTTKAQAQSRRQRLSARRTHDES